MKHIFTLLCAAVLVVTMSSCRQKHPQTRSIHIPAMKNEECAQIINNALHNYARLPNMENAVVTTNFVFDLERRVLIIQYDSMKCEIKNLEHAIAQAGFQANEIPADPAAAAKLPPKCK